MRKKGLWLSKSYEELTFVDDFMFCKIMTSRPDLCKELLELVLDIKIKEINFPESQKSIEHTYNGKVDRKFYRDK